MDLKATDPLEGLLSEALAHRTPPKQRKSMGDRISLGELSAAAKRVREYFTNPENWHMTRHVTLIHKESQTLLGNFTEYRHNQQKDCRKLLRCEQPAVVDAIEEVEGDNWHNLPMIGGTDSGTLVAEDREIIIDIHLPEMDHVFAPAVLVTVRLEQGGIRRVELMDETRFFDKAKRVQLILPAGIDVLEGMSFDCRVELRKALGL